MKAIFKNAVLKILRYSAEKKLEKINPQIVGITGSVGKTSTKEAIAEVLSRRFIIKKSQGGYNTEFGILLTILEKKSAYSSPFKWLNVIASSFIESFKKPEKYNYLVMEMGVDKPGDMDEILKVIRPDIMIFTAVKDAHLEEGQFKNREAILEEKSKSCFAVPKDGWVILNHDDLFVKQLESKLIAQVVKIGTSEGSDIRAKNISGGPEGLKFTLAYEKHEINVVLPNILGECHVLSVLAAIAVGFIAGLQWKTIEAGLKEFRLPPGRMSKIEGKNGSTIIDSTYNASPATMEEALKILGTFHGRKIAALGTMNELGELAESAHIKVAKLAASYADLLIFVGKFANEMADGANRAGTARSMIHVFKNSNEAGEYLNKILEKNDVLLAKGSQNNVRMEHIVKLCMREPEKARTLLVRQEPYWLKNS